MLEVILGGEKMNGNPIFILGSHKSGSSLLRNLFDGHSELFVIPIEAHFFQYNGYWIDYGIRRQMPVDLTEGQIINNYVSAINLANTTPGGYSDSDTRGMWDVEKFEEKIKKGKNYNNIKSSIINYIEAMYYSISGTELPEDKRVVEKSVENAEFAIDLKTIFPNAKFIHIVRNPYATLVAIRKFKSQQGYPFLKWIIESMYNSYYYLEKNQRLFSKKDYLVLKYEDLVTQPKMIIKKIITFLDLPEEKILYIPTVQKKLWEGNSTSGEKFKSISSKRLNKWKDEIYPLEAQVVNFKFEFILKKYGYEVITEVKERYPEDKKSIDMYNFNANFLKLL